MFNQIQKEIKMFKNRFILALGVLSLLLSTLAFAKPLAKLSPKRIDEATDFYQRHPDWKWATSDQNALIPVTGDEAFPDYFQRHPELSVAIERSIDTTDYFFRHLDKNASPLVVSFSADQIRREYVLGERYGVTPQEYSQQQALREYWLGERYGVTPQGYAEQQALREYWLGEKYGQTRRS
jgi:hypothetical protein